MDKKSYKLKDIAEPIAVAVTDPQKSCHNIFVGLEHYDSGEPVISRFSDTSLLSSSCKAFQKNDILIARRNVYLRRAGIVPFDGLTSGDSIVLRIFENCEKTTGIPYDVAIKILPFVLNSNSFWVYANRHADGMNSKRISKEKVLDYEFVLPPLAEQTVLADKLWAAYEVKQSYLKMIEATEEMVKSQFVKTIEAEGNKRPFNNCVLNMTKGPFGSDIKKSLYVPKTDSSYKVYIQVNAIEKNLSLGDYYISKAYFDEKMYKFEVKPGDYIITCDGTLGKYIKLPNDIERGIISASLLRLTLKDNILPIFFEYLWDFYIMTELSKEVRNTALKHLPSASKIGEMIVPLPGISIQKKFSDIAEQADKTISELRKSIDAIDKVIKSLINENL